MKRVITYLVPMLLLTMFSCQRIVITDNGNKDNEYVSVKFTMPNMGMPQTKALSSGDFNSVERVDILAFSIEDESLGKEYYKYHTYTTDITNLGNKKEFIAKLKNIPGSEYRFVLLINLDQTQIDMIPGLSKTDKKADVLATIIHRKNDWNSTTALNASLDKIPMWGESVPVIVDNTLATIGIGEVPVVRILSAIDVEISGANAKSKFKLAEVHLYNRSVKGCIVPESASINELLQKVTYATVPSSDSSDPLTVKSPISYQAATDTKLAHTIFTYEAKAPAQGKYAEATCLVIGGYYGTDTYITYYRVDFTNTAGTEFRDVIRNTHNVVNINDVINRGHQTADKAFDSRTNNMKVSILTWQMGSSVDAVTDGQNILKVSKGSFILDKNEHFVHNIDNKLTIFTDVEGGWKINKIVNTAQEDITWLYTVAGDMTGAKDTEKTISILTKDNNSSARTGYIYIEAGRLTYKLQVDQLAGGDLELAIYDENNNEINELFFPCYAEKTLSDIPAQSFTVRWKPFVGIPCIYNTTQFKAPFEFGSGSFPASGILSDAEGFTQFLNIKPQPISKYDIYNNPFLEKVSRFNFEVTKGSEKVSKYILLRQTNYSAVPLVDSLFLLDGGTKSFKIKSNTAWKIYLEDDNAGDPVLTNFSDGQSGGYNTVDGDEVFFTIADKRNTTTYDGTIKFRLKSTDPNRPFEDIIFKVYCIAGSLQPRSNCYMATPSAIGTILYIPVDNGNYTKYPKANYTGHLGEDWLNNHHRELNEEFLWTDNSFGLSQKSAVKYLKAVGGGTWGCLVVVTGEGEGNALVAATSKTIFDTSISFKWSWHIWVTPYDPNVNSSSVVLGKNQSADGTGHIYKTNIAIFMDRNLGGLTATASDPRSKGFLYQWGRKDPFVSNRDYMDSGYIGPETKLYNEKGERITSFTPVNVASIPGNMLIDNVYTLKYAVMNPTTYITSSTGDRNWAFTVYLLDRCDFMWQAGFDAFNPCPIGWELKQSSQMYPLTSTNFLYDAANYCFYGDGTNGTLDIGTFPMAGNRDGQTGNYLNDRAMGNYMMAQPSAGRAGILYFAPPNIVEVGGLGHCVVDRSAAGSVRCVMKN